LWIERIHRDGETPDITGLFSLLNDILFIHPIYVDFGISITWLFVFFISRAGFCDPRYF